MFSDEMRSGRWLRSKRLCRCGGHHKRSPTGTAPKSGREPYRNARGVYSVPLGSAGDGKQHQNPRKKAGYIDLRKQERDERGETAKGDLFLRGGSGLEGTAWNRKTGGPRSLDIYAKGGASLTWSICNLWQKNDYDSRIKRRKSLAETTGLTRPLFAQCRRSKEEGGNRCIDLSLPVSSGGGKKL